MGTRDPQQRKELWQVIVALQQNDFAFSVEALGTPWDVYRFENEDGQRGMIAFRLLELDEGDKKVDVGFFKLGLFTEEEIVQALNQTAS